MNPIIAETIRVINSGVSCRGLEGAPAIETLVSKAFAADGITFDGWKISEIPVADNSGNYPVAVVVCVCNPALRRGISVNFTADGALYDVTPDELAQIRLSSIAEAISHPDSIY